MSGPASASAIFLESRDSALVARLDPRVRVAAALSFMIALVPLHAALPLVAALAAGVAAAVLARVPVEATLRRLAAIEGFLMLLLVTLPFTMDGTELFGLLGWPASREGFERALVIFARVNAAVLVAAALLSTMGAMRLAGAMAGIGVPGSIAHLFQLTVRYIAVFHDEYTRLRRAMRARAFQAGSNRHSWRTLGNLVGMLLVRSVERAERVAWAMKCRGFSGSFPVFDQRELGPADFCFAVLWAALIGGLLALEYFG